MLKRKKSLKEKKKERGNEIDFEVIKFNLSEKEFRAIHINDMTSPGLSLVISNNAIPHYAKAKLTDDNQVHIRIENVYGYVFEGFTTNYRWFLENFSFKSF